MRRFYLYPLLCSLCVFARTHTHTHTHTHAFVSTDINFPARSLLPFSNFQHTNRYSYAQKKYNPDGAKKPKKKIGAKKKKMLLMKSGMRRPE